MKYDVIIVGAGPAGLFSAYELITKNSKLKIAVIDKGYFVKNLKSKQSISIYLILLNVV